MGIPRELVEAVRRHHVIPFVGAGVSRGAGPFPGWKDLLEGLVGELTAEQLEEAAAEVRGHIAADNFLDAAEMALKQLGAYRFNRFLRRRFRLARPDNADLSVVRALWALEPPLILTTNYDDVLTWGNNQAEQLANDQADELALMHAEEGPNAPRIWHLHGTIHRLSTLILGGSDYQRLYGERPEAAGVAMRQEDLQRQQGAYSAYAWAVAELEKRMAARPFLYVGFSFNDPYVLRQVKYVLQATRGKAAPSYALMKRGEGNRAHLWSNYNIQLIEYENHGSPLVAWLAELRRAAFGDSAPPSLEFLWLSKPRPPAPPGAAPPMPGGAVPMGGGAEVAEDIPPAPPPAHVPRMALVQDYAGILANTGRLVLLAPRRGGARSLAGQIAERYDQRVSWLAPPNHPDATEAEYCRVLAGNEGVTNFEGLVEHLRRRATGLGGAHLVVLRYEWGPFEHLKTLGNHLRRLLEEKSKVPFHVLVAGGIRSAWLIHHMERFSAFQDAPRREVPDFTVDEVRQLLVNARREGVRAEEVHAATGGHLGLLNEALLGGPPFDAETVTRHLARSPVLRDAVHERLREDARNRETGQRHARWVLRELLEGREVERLENLRDQTEYAEVRLYFDGLVRRDGQGRTVLRCPAVAEVATRALARKEKGP